MPLEELNGIVEGVLLDSAQILMDDKYLCEEWGLPPKHVPVSGEGHW